MKKCTVLLGVFFILFTAILPSLAAELTFTGEYSNSTENEYLIETEGFNSIFKPGKLSLNVGYTYKDTEFNVGIKDFNLRDNYLGAPRYKLGQSIYVGFDSNNFNFSYLRGNYDKYGFNVEDDVIGFNMMYSYATMRGKFEEDAFNYLLPGFIAGIDFVITHENLFKAGFSIGKLSVLAYYFDSYYVFNKVDYNNPYNNKNYETTALLDSDFNGLALNANLNLNKYFNIGVTYSSLNYYESHKQYVGTFFDFYRDVETLGFNVSGKLPVISGEYFANVVMADYQNSDGSIHYKSEKPALNVGLRDIALRDDSMVKVGVDYALTNSETYLASNNNSSLGQVV